MTGAEFDNNWSDINQGGGFRRGEDGGGCGHPEGPQQ